MSWSYQCRVTTDWFHIKHPVQGLYKIGTEDSFVYILPYGCTYVSSHAIFIDPMIFIQKSCRGFLLEEAVDF